MAQALAYTPELLSLAQAGYGIYAGEEGRRQQKKARSQQAQAQKTAEGQAKRQADMAVQAEKRANRQQPDVGMLLAAAQRQGETGGLGTMLTGPSGVNPDRLRLGRNSLLGG